MGDVGDFYNGIRDARRERRAKHGRDCPVCIERHPKRNPTLLLPGQRCKVDGYVDKRPKLEDGK